jgi:hypothetical protein
MLAGYSHSTGFFSYKKKKEEKKKERVRHPFTPKDCVDVMQWPQKAIP